MAVNVPPAAARPLRRDAERNRGRILDAARVLFAERGLEVAIDEIARAAGVGVGTLYRRFPTREDLIDALFEERIERLIADGEDALRHPDPWEGLAGFLERTLEVQAADRGLKQVMHGHAHGRRCLSRSHERIAPLLERLVARARAAGSLRPDVEAGDLPLLAAMLGAVADHAHTMDPELWRRYLGLVLDGLRTRRDAPTPLAAAALPVRDVLAPPA